MTTFPDSALRLFTNAIVNHTVSIADRYNLMSALLDRDLNAAECAAVDRLVQTLQPSTDKTPRCPRPAIVHKVTPILQLPSGKLQLVSC
ncbi:MAG: hypothetical protein F6J87_07315 [Spirulina sp. SIO3F2]|nr:hypothetical protein [Spirulina sp. SIO3F2]